MRRTITTWAAFPPARSARAAMSLSHGSICSPRWSRPSAPRKRKIHCLDEFRRAREDLEPNFYNSLTYFEMWTHGFINLMEEKGVLTRAEVEMRAAEIKDRLKRTA